MEGARQKARQGEKNTITKESEGKQWALESILTYHISVNICGIFYALLNGYNLWQRKPVLVASSVKKDTVFFYLIFCHSEKSLSSVGFQEQLNHTVMYATDCSFKAEHRMAKVHRLVGGDLCPHLSSKVI